MSGRFPWNNRETKAFIVYFAVSHSNTHKPPPTHQGSIIGLSSVINNGWIFHSPILLQAKPISCFPSFTKPIPASHCLLTNNERSAEIRDVCALMLPMGINFGEPKELHPISKVFICVEQSSIEISRYPSRHTNLLHTFITYFRRIKCWCLSLYEI